MRRAKVRVREIVSCCALQFIITGSICKQYACSVETKITESLYETTYCVIIWPPVYNFNVC